MVHIKTVLITDQQGSDTRVRTPPKNQVFWGVHPPKKPPQKTQTSTLT